MTYILVDELELHRMINSARNYPVHRDYDAEWDFTKQMDELGEMKMPFAMIVKGIDILWAGVALIIIQFPEAQNDNALAILP